MTGVLLLLLLRPLVERPMRLLAGCLGGVLLVVAFDLLLDWFVDPHLPRPLFALLALAVASAARFLRASWRRHAWRRRCLR